MNLYLPAAIFAAAVVAGPALIHAQSTPVLPIPAPAVTAIPVPVTVLGPSSASAMAMVPFVALQPMTVAGTTTPLAAVGATGPATPDAPTAAAATEPTPAPQPSLSTAPVAPPKPIVTLSARVNLSTQRMHVSVNGKPTHVFPISSGREGFQTPRGTFTPGWQAREWYSKQYDDAPMPFAVFFNNGIATHATQSTGMLGQPASHGCVRLTLSNAETFYKLVSRHGLKHTRIVVEGTTPRPMIARKRPTNDGYGTFSPFGFVPGPQAYRAPQGARVVYRAPSPQAYPMASNGWGWQQPQPSYAAPRGQRLAGNGVSARRPAY